MLRGGHFSEQRCHSAGDFELDAAVSFGPILRHLFEPHETPIPSQDQSLTDEARRIGLPFVVTCRTYSKVSYVLPWTTENNEIDKNTTPYALKDMHATCRQIIIERLALSLWAPNRLHAGVQIAITKSISDIGKALTTNT